tara:strand:+ start:12 stop:134 length:123 start_codon:yes stop_codon:yes gene_type:complete
MQKEISLLDTEVAKKLEIKIAVIKNLNDLICIVYKKQLYL